MAISKSKRRYQVSLTPSVVDRFQSLAKDLGMPASVMSGACEDALKTIADVFQVAKEKGTLEISDLKRLIDTQMELIQTDERKQDGNKKRTKTKAA